MASRCQIHLTLLNCGVVSLFYIGRLKNAEVNAVPALGAAFKGTSNAAIEYAVEASAGDNDRDGISDHFEDEVAIHKKRHIRAQLEALHANSKLCEAN